MKTLLIILVTLIFGPFAISAEVLQGESLNVAIGALKEQKGGSRGYPDWASSIMYNEPALSIYKSAYGNMDGVIAGLKKVVSDKTQTVDCWHEGRGGARMLYTVGDIACCILAQIHNEDSIEILVTEMQRRRNEKEDYAAIAWAIRYYDSAFRSKVLNKK